MTDEETNALEVAAYNLGSIATALRDIGIALHVSNQLERERFERQYPGKKEVRDAIVTHRQTEEERLREAQGASDESDQEWTGWREKKFVEDHAKATPRPQKRGTGSSGSN
jgi:hypothetical protein